MIAIAMLLTVAGRQQRVVAQRFAAVQEAANVMERVMGLSWDELSSERLASLQLPPETQRTLTLGRVNVELIAEDSSPPAKQVMVRIDWQDASGERVEPIQLTAWKYRLQTTPTK
jgi:hypothetical protein